MQLCTINTKTKPNKHRTASSQIHSSVFLSHFPLFQELKNYLFLCWISLSLQLFSTEPLRKSLHVPQDEDMETRARSRGCSMVCVPSSLLGSATLCGQLQLSTSIPSLCNQGGARNPQMNFWTLKKHFKDRSYEVDQKKRYNIINLKFQTQNVNSWGLQEAVN